MSKIDILEKGEGWVIFKLRDAAKPSPASSAELADAMVGWLHQHRGIMVNASLPIIAGGETVAIHLWTDQGTW